MNLCESCKTAENAASGKKGGRKPGSGQEGGGEVSANEKELIDAINLAGEKERKAFDEWQAAVKATAEAKKALAWHKSGLKPGDRVEYMSGSKWIPAVAHYFCENGWWLLVRRILKDGSISESTANAYSSWQLEEEGMAK